MTIQVENPMPAGPPVPSVKRKRKSGTSGAANDCFACQKKNQPCDRVRPYCGQCLKVAVECSGYKTVLTWGVGVASRGKLRGQALPIKKPDLPSEEKPSAEAPRKAQTRLGSLEMSQQRKSETHSQAPTKRARTASYAASTLSPYPAYPYAHPDGSANFDAVTARAPPYPSGTREAHHSHPEWPRQHSSFEQAHFPHAIYSAIDPHQERGTVASSTAPQLSKSQLTYTPGPCPVTDPFSQPTQSQIDDPFVPNNDYPSFTAPGRRPILHEPEPRAAFSQQPASFEGFHDQSERSVSSPLFRQNEHTHQSSITPLDMSIYPTLSAPQRSIAWELDPQLVDDALEAEDGSGQITELAPSAIAFPLLDHLTHLPPRMRYIMDFYDKAICPVLVTSDGPSNPYRMHILQLAVNSEALQSAIAALVTNNMRMRLIRNSPQIKHEIDDGLDGLASDIASWPGNASPEEQHHKARSIEALNKQLTSNNSSQASSDTVLATLLILCLFHVCNSGFSKFRTQLAGVQKLLRMRNNIGSKSNFVGWVETFFAWFDVMTSAVNDRELEITGDSLDMVDLSTNLGAMEQFSGCDGRLFKIIARLSRLNLLSQNRPIHDMQDSSSNGLALESKLAHKGNKTGDFYSLDFEDDASAEHEENGNTEPQNDPDPNRQVFWQEWQDTHDRLWAWQVQLPQPQTEELPSTSSVQENAMVDLSEAFRYSALLYVERLAHPELPSSSINFQTLVESSLSHIEAIGLGSCVTKFMLWPLFITGTECTKESHRNLIRDRCIEIQRESGFYNNLSALRVLERIWKETDGPSVIPPNGQAFRWRLAMDRLDGDPVAVALLASHRVRADTLLETLDKPQLNQRQPGLELSDDLVRPMHLKDVTRTAHVAAKQLSARGLTPANAPRRRLSPHHPGSRLAARHLSTKHNITPERPPLPNRPQPAPLETRARLHREQRLVFSPLPFSFSLANTGNPIIEEEIEPYDIAIPGIRPSLPPNIMSDQDYAAFLEKASGDSSSAQTSESTSGAGKKKGFTTNSVDSEVPQVLKGVDATYTSEADESFEVVSLSVGKEGSSGNGVGLDQFTRLTGHSDAESLGVQAFDPRGEYSKIVDKVKQAGNGQVEIFRVQLKGARCEYWILSADEAHKTVVGMRVGAVES